MTSQISLTVSVLSLDQMPRGCGHEVRFRVSFAAAATFWWKGLKKALKQP